MGKLEVPKIKLALFDMAGTTVDDMVVKPGSEMRLPLVIAAYQDAFKQGGIDISYEQLNDCRGRDKLEVFKEKVIKYRTDLSGENQQALARQLHDEVFVPALLDNVQYVREVTGTTETFQYLKDKRVFVATGSGFPKVVTDAINDHLGWKDAGLVDYVTCGESAGGGRPKPNMINDVLVVAGFLQRGIDLSQQVEGFDYRGVLKVGDTVKDIQEGLGVGATTIAVSSGTQSREKLVKAGTMVVLLGVTALPQYLENQGYFG